MTDWRHFYERMPSDEVVRQRADRLFIIGVSANKMLGRASTILDTTLVCKMAAERLLFIGQNRARVKT